MIPYEVDPSLHPAEPAPPQLDDGFSPPEGDTSAKAATTEDIDPSLWAKSEF